MHDVTSDHNPPQQELNHPKSQTSTVHTSDAHSSTMTEAGMKEVNENENETTSPEEGADNNKKDLEGAEEEGKKDDKRYIPSYKKPDAALTFPEKVSGGFSSLYESFNPSVADVTVFGIANPMHRLLHRDPVLYR